MGVSLSRNVAKVTMDAIVNVSTNIIENSTVSSTQGQGIIISGNSGGVKVGNITQREVLTLNTSALMSAMSTSSAQQNLIQTMNQTAKAITSGINIGQASVADSEISSYLKASVDIATNISNLCSAGISQEQSIVISGNQGGISTGNIDQTQIGNIFASCVTNAVSNSQAAQQIQQTLTQSSEAESQGISPWGIVAIVAICVIGTVIPIVTIGNKVIKYAYFFLIVIGIGLIITYFVYQPITVKLTKYSMGLDTSSGCAPSGAVKFTTFATALDAANECLSNKDYQAFDWKGFELSSPNGQRGSPLPQPETIFYTGVTPTCTIIQDQNISLFRRPTFTCGSSPSGPVSAEVGDYYVDIVTGQGYIFQLNIGWASDVVWPNKGNNITFETSAPPATPISGIWADVSNPKSINVYLSNGGKWISQGTVVGPGYAIIQTINANTSGIKINSTKPWLLWLGGACIAMGFIAMAISFAYAPKAAVKPAAVKPAH